MNIQHPKSAIKLGTLALVLFTSACTKDDSDAAPAPPGGNPNTTDCGTVTDIDGNVYGTVRIGGQCWIKENLQVTHYRNGDEITSDLDSAEWQTAATGATCIYEDSAALATTYGRLYNWYAVADPRGLCPQGWHPPSATEWQLLEQTLGLPANAAGNLGMRGIAENVGGKMKSVSALWTAPNGGATNSSGYSALPAGTRGTNSLYYGLNTSATWWSVTEASSTTGWSRYLSHDVGGIGGYDYTKTVGLSCRCIAD
jgi:uncharacterized protein (TIGR02145 family)